MSTIVRAAGSGVAPAAASGVPVFNVQSPAYGAAGTGIANDTSAISAALTAAGLVKGTVTGPPGTYLIDSISVPSGVTFDFPGSTFKANSATANYLIRTLSTTGATIRNLTIDLNGLTKDAIRLDAATDATVQNVKVTNGVGIAVRCDNACVRPRIVDVTALATRVALLLNGGTADASVRSVRASGQTVNTTFEGAIYLPNCVRATLVDVHVDTCAGHGFWIGGSSTADVNLIGCRSRGNGASGTAIEPRGYTVDSSCTRVTFTTCHATDNWENGWLITATTSDVNLVRCLARGNNVGLRPGGHGIEHLGQRGSVVACTASNQLGSAAKSGCGIYSGANGANVQNCHVEGNFGSGIRITGLNAICTGNEAVSNSQRGVGLDDGIEVIGLSAGACQDAVISGNRCYDTQATKTQRYGIAIINTNVDFYVVTGNATRGNATGGLSDTGGTNKTVTNNI